MVSMIHRFSFFDSVSRSGDILLESLGNMTLYFLWEVVCTLIADSARYNRTEIAKVSDAVMPSFFANYFYEQILQFTSREMEPMKGRRVG